MVEKKIRHAKLGAEKQYLLKSNHISQKKKRKTVF
jgi:hypothetical protein